MKKLMFALACAASAAVMGTGTDTLTNKATFAAFDVGTKAEALTDKTDDNQGTGRKFWQFAKSPVEDDASVVAGDDNNKYLQLETNGDELQRKVQSNGAAFTVGDNGLYIDTLVQFTATPADSVTQVDGAKLAIWLEGEDTYTLKVAGAQLTLDEYNAPKATSKTYTVSGSYQPEKWYRLTVKAVPTLTTGLTYPAFQIFIDDDPVAMDVATCDAACIAYITNIKAWVTGMDTLVTEKKVILSGACAQDGYDTTAAATLTCVGFQGSGAIDNVTITDADPLADNTTVSFTIDLGDNVTAVSYTIGTADAVTINDDATFDVAPGATVTVTAATAADWYTVTLPDAVTASAENDSIEVTATKVEVTGGALPEGTTAAGLGITNGVFASENATALAPVVKWAQAYGKTPADINEMTFGATYTQTEAAYLFNCADSKEAVDQEKEEFKLTITFDANGAPVVSGPEGKTYNGTVEVKGKASLSDAEWATKDDTNHKFFKAFLTK